MTSTKPYLIRAIYEWCTDEGFTPYLAVQVDARTRVPREFVRDGQIVLNVSADATHQMSLGNDEVAFQARFNGASFPVLVPVDAVLAIYARENGQGMAFDVASDAGNVAPLIEAGAGEAFADQDEPHAPAASSVRRGSHLTRIK